MKEVIEQLINDKFHSDNGSIDFSCPKLELELKKDEIRESDFQVVSTTGAVVKGIIVTSNLRIRLVTTEFEGVQSTVRFYFDSTGMEEGDIVKGEIHIVSNFGEYYLPIIVSVEHSVVKTSLGSIKNLFHFANLAKTNWLEAVNLFYSKDFNELFGANDKQYYGAYEGLSRIPGNQQNLNEFLIVINKKQKIEYLVDTTSFVIENPKGVVEEGVTITRNGWGYIYLQLEIQGDFLYTEKRNLLEEDFLGNQCGLKFYVDSKKLHEGNNFGKIIIYNTFHKIEILVTAVQEWANHGNLQKRQELENLNVQLMKQYLKFRTQQISTSEWLKKTEPIVEKLNSYEAENPEYRLYQAHFLIGEDRFNEAKWILDHIEAILVKKDYDPEVWCYYLYLTTLQNRQEDYINKVAREVQKIYGNYPTSWRIGWIVMFLDEEYNHSPSKKWVFMEEIFEKGCTSPVIYVEAYQLLKSTPTLLRKLSGFELQVLRFAQKNHLLNADVIGQIHYQINKVKGFSDLLFELLEACYSQKKDSETLSAICSLLISGNKTGSRYFSWYQKGVQENLRITKLYEYYMMSIDLSYTGELPRMVVMYFAYQSELSYEIKAFLYANILIHKKNYQDLESQYMEEMERFVLEQIRKCKINDNLSYLYRTLISGAMINKEVANQLAPLLFMHEAVISNPSIKRVIVVHGKVCGEISYPVINGRAQFPIYSVDNRIFLEDEKQNRYLQTIPFEIRKLFNYNKLITMISPYINERLGFDMNICEGNRNYVSITGENAQRYFRLAISPKITDEYKRDIRLKLAQYYYESDMIRELDFLLEKMEPSKMDVKERGEFIQYLVTRGMYDMALAWIKNYGVEGVQTKSLVRLCGRILERDGMEYDRDILAICYSAFSGGKYDEVILTYLCKYYEGTIKNLRDIWRGAKDFGLDLKTISERIIVQMLFSGAFVGDSTLIFESYKKEGTSLKIEMAYLCQNAYDFFVLDRVMNPDLFSDIGRHYMREDSINLICKLAYLKYFAENLQERTPAIMVVAGNFIRDIVSLHLLFPFFKDYTDCFPEISRFLDRTMIEYKSKPESKVVIHYLIEKEDSDNEYMKEEMTNMYSGIFVKSFVLFFGERLQYYITEESDRKEQLTESGTISKSDIGNTVKESRFNMLNDLAIGKTLQDYDTVDTVIEDYLLKNFITEKLFHVL